MAFDHFTQALSYHEQESIKALTRSTVLNVYWRFEVSGVAVALHLTGLLRYFKSVRSIPLVVRND